MSLEFKLSRKIGFHLTSWYSAILILNSLILFVLIYISLDFSLQQKDKKIIQSETEDYKAAFENGGINRLTSELNEMKAEIDPTGEDTFFVRLAGAGNITVFLYIPAKWPSPDLKRLEEISGEGNEQWSYVPANDAKNIYEIFSKRLSTDLVLQVGKPTRTRKRILTHFRSIFVQTVIPIVIVGFAGGLLLASRALRPIRYLIKTTGVIIDTGKITARVPTGTRDDELGELSRLFNTMLEKIESLIKGMREGLDNVAHDFRTPLTRIRINAEMALHSEDDIDDLRGVLVNCIEEVDWMLTMLNTLMDISEAETGTMKLALKDEKVSSLIGEVIDLYSYASEEKNIVIKATLPEVLCVVADRNRLQQAIANLLDNAIKYTPAGGAIDIQASREHQHIVISIKDTGIGISPAELPRIWDRLYRGDKSRSQRGLGLGLSLVKAIIQAHKGHVVVSSEPDKGSTFVVYIPSEP
jgi:signal transduction histidine kinase